MKFLKTKKSIALVASVVVVAIAAVGAYAYFTSAGTGSGNATVGANTTSITLAGTIANAIVPGDGGQTVSFTALNGSSTTTGYVGSISLGTVSSLNVGCQVYLGLNQGDFSFLTDPVVESTPVPTGFVPTAMPNNATLVWANSNSADQTPCVGKTLVVGVTSS